MCSALLAARSSARKAILTLPTWRLSPRENFLLRLLLWERDYFELSEMGRVARMQDLASHFLGKEATAIDRALVWRLFLSWQKTSRLCQNDALLPSGKVLTLGAKIRARVEEAKTIKKQP